MPSLPERYVLLSLRVGRHIDGFIDVYFGPPELRARADSEEPQNAEALREETEALLDGLPSEDLEPDRRRWLRYQLQALACTTARLAGEEITWSDEVERCLGVRPARVDTKEFEDVHRRLDAVLPGTGSVRDRYNAWDRDNAIAPDRLEPALERLKDLLRDRVRQLVELPPGEAATYEIVSGEPWIAYNWYQGGYRSRVEVNADLPISVALLADLAAHEVYPGHHTERCLKEARLCNELGRTEATIAVLSAPEALVSEGIAMNSLQQALGQDAFQAIAASLADLGIEFAPEVATEIRRAEMALYGTATNAAFMLHEDNTAAEEVEEYLREWGLESDERARQTVAFITDPALRTYVSSYTDARRLCRDFIDRAPDNFERLLTEQLTTVDLLV
jgi:hypothetical protein